MIDADTVARGNSLGYQLNLGQRIEGQAKKIQNAEMITLHSVSGDIVEKSKWMKNRPHDKGRNVARTWMKVADLRRPLINEERSQDEKIHFPEFLRLVAGLCRLDPVRTIQYFKSANPMSP